MDKRNKEESYKRNRDKYLKAFQEKNTLEFRKKKSEYDKKRRLNQGDELRAYDRKRRDIDYFGGNTQTVLERDNHQCCLCDSNDQLIIHHLDGTGQYPKRSKHLVNTDIDNLKTLCRSCHIKEHIDEILIARRPNGFNYKKESGEQLTR